MFGANALLPLLGPVHCNVIIKNQRKEFFKALNIGASKITRCIEEYIFIDRYTLLKVKTINCKCTPNAAIMLRNKSANRIFLFLSADFVGQLERLH